MHEKLQAQLKHRLTARALADNALTKQVRELMNPRFSETEITAILTYWATNSIDISAEKAGISAEDAKSVVFTQRAINFVHDIHRQEISQVTIDKEFIRNEMIKLYGMCSGNIPVPTNTGQWSKQFKPETAQRILRDISELDGLYTDDQQATDDPKQAGVIEVPAKLDTGAPVPVVDEPSKNHATPANSNGDNHLAQSTKE